MEYTPEFIRKAGEVWTELANVAIFLREHGFYERAIAAFLVLSKGDPSYESGTYAYDIGLCYEKMGKIDEAAMYFEISTRENPQMTPFSEALNRTKKIQQQ